MALFNLKHTHLQCIISTITLALAAVTMLISSNSTANEKIQSKHGVTINFDSNTTQALTQQQKKTLTSTVFSITKHSKALLPQFPQQVTVNIALVDKDLDKVGGVSGIAQTPTSINLDIAKMYTKGINEAIAKGVKNTLYHEYHHLARGWTIEENRFGPGIAIAAANEGLATVFAEQYSGIQDSWLHYPNSVSEWVREIINLPDNAPYDIWMMGKHPDGRENIGYKAGTYIVHQAIKNSGLSVLELSKLSPFEILDLSGEIKNHSTSLEKLADFYAKNQLTEDAINTYKRAINALESSNPTVEARYQKKIDLLVNPIVISKQQQQSYTGEYSSERLNLFILLSEDEYRLQVKLPGKPAFTLHPDSKSTFFIYEADVKFEFVKQPDLPTYKLIANIFGQRFELNKS
ncbi:DUF2268 domain-containing protein [Pseudoalteromonas sp. JBTF-M23]|uniref:DUF2268 domain-containing protein n=1 Tax=Pseudoalteromonas caenipelagi TaxID=2726988 RepID=A0A849VI10_9GAMM|nr:DUF2268 domain-containing putative Zn-dependent protease [Pseudoalteromonas caenipelagi]NOU51484.1 DUF2268 domain-containing protein [Pseudoalteromonas caenipelagi]